jgi:N-acetylmuramoyl-L-alanine amidase
MRYEAPVLLALLIMLALAPSASATGRAPVVVLDPGHNAVATNETEPIGPGSRGRKPKSTTGATGVATGQREPVLVLDVALRLRPLLRRAGVRVVMTRTRTAGTSIGGRGQALVANRARADLFLRIHADGSEDPGVRGTHTLYPAWHRGWTDDIYRPSRRAARIVQRAVVRRLGFPDRGLQERGDLSGFNWSNRPSVLVELGFLSNPIEDRLLATPAYRRRAARGLCEGALRFLGRSTAAC